MGWKVDKQTGIGLGASVCMVLLSLLFCALLLVRGALPESTVKAWLWVSYGLAALFGGRIAAAGQGRELCALLPAAFLYGLVWLLALSCKVEIQFATLGIGITVAVIIGALLAFMTANRKRKKKSHYNKKRPVARTLRR